MSNHRIDDRICDVCKTGLTNFPQCDTCSEGSFDDDPTNETQCIPCECDTDGSVTSICDQNSGQCTCNNDQISGTHW